MISIKIEDTQLQQAIDQVTQQVKNPKKVLSVVGEALMRQHKERFAQQKAPDGTPWKPLNPLYAQGKKYGKGRVLKARGYLSEKLAYNISGNTLAFGSGMKYARIHQYGGRIEPKNGNVLKYKMGHSFRTSRAVHIPARPWLGISQSGKQDIEGELVQTFSRLLNMS